MEFDTGFVQIGQELEKLEPFWHPRSPLNWYRATNIPQGGAGKVGDVKNHDAIIV